MSKIIKTVLLSVVSVTMLFAMNMKFENCINILPFLQESQEELNAVTFLNEQSVVAALFNPASQKERLRIFDFATSTNRDIAQFGDESRQLMVGYGETIMRLSHNAVHLINTRHNTKASYPLLNSTDECCLYTVAHKPIVITVTAQQEKQLVEEWHFDPTREGMMPERGSFVNKICDCVQRQSTVCPLYTLNGFVMAASQKPGAIHMYCGDFIPESHVIPYKKNPLALALDPCAQSLAVYSVEGALELIDLETQQLVWRVDVAADSIEINNIVAHLFFSNDGEYLVLQIGSLALSKAAQKLLIMHSKTGKILAELALPNTGKKAILSADNRYLMLLVDDAQDGSVWLYSLVKGLV